MVDFESFLSFCFLYFLFSLGKEIQASELPKSEVKVDADEEIGSLEIWRHSFGQGGINPIPLPIEAIEGIKKLHPRLLRIFIQEYFNIYRDDGTFHWEILDPYMDALAQTGAKIVGCITIKPRRLFPKIDQKVWQPTDIEEWQRVIYQLVERYSVVKPIVTYWEIANEPDIGEDGGTPYLISEPNEYCEFYKMTIEPIIKACPTVKVGGPALASVDSLLLNGLVEFCKKTGTKLDFLSWHLYSDDPQSHSQGIKKVKEMVKDFPGQKPELLITEWNRSIPQVTGGAKDASIISACLISMENAGVDWTFYYQIWDQVFYKKYFANWFSPQGIENMSKFWDPVPPFGLFNLEGEARTTYFVYQMLYRMGGTKISTTCADPDIKVLASRTTDEIFVFLTNTSSEDKSINVHISGLQPGIKSWKIYLLGERQTKQPYNLEQFLTLQRSVTTSSYFSCDIYAPSYSVIQAILAETH